MNSEREKADILFDYGLPLQFCCHLIQFYTLLFLRVATLNFQCVILSEAICVTSCDSHRFHGDRRACKCVLVTVHIECNKPSDSCQT